MKALAKALLIIFCIVSACVMTYLDFPSFGFALLVLSALIAVFYDNNIPL